MTTTDSPDLGSDQPPAEAPGSSEIFLGAGQALWLALVTVVSVAALVLAIVAVAVAYDDDGGSSGSSSASGSGGGSDAPPATSADFSAVEFAFEPDFATIAAGTDVEINLVNDGAVQHELVILDAGVNISSEADFIDSMLLSRTAALDSGASDSITVNLQPGTYQIVCLIAGHFDAGMEGELVAS